MVVHKIKRFGCKARRTTPQDQNAPMTYEKINKSMPNPTFIYNTSGHAFGEQTLKRQLVFVFI